MYLEAKAEDVQEKKDTEATKATYVSTETPNTNADESAAVTAPSKAEIFLQVSALYYAA